MRVLIVGLGSIGQRHARNLRRLFQKEVFLSAVRRIRATPFLTDAMEIQPEKTPEQELGIEVFSNLDLALKQRPDITFVCNPTSMHLETALKSIEAGSHVFLEKPVSHRIDGCISLLDTASSMKRVVYVGYQMRFHPCFERLQSLISSNRMGKIYSASAEIGEYLPAWHKYEDYRSTYGASKDLGGGVIVTQSHEIDYLIALFGMPESVFAVGGKFSDLEIDVEDCASSIWKTKQGQSIRLHQDYMQRPPRRTLEIIAEKMRVTVDWIKGELVCHQHDGKIDIFQPEGWQRNDMFLAQMRHFFSCVRGDTAPRVSLKDGLKSLALASAIKTSLMCGEKSTLDPVDWGESLED